MRKWNEKVLQAWYEGRLCDAWHYLGAERQKGGVQFAVWAPNAQDVRVTGDLQHASVFYTVLGEEEDRATAGEILEAYRGRLRSFVGRGLGIRLTPSLEFILDALPEDAAHMDELLRQVAERDAELARERAAAGYAGDPDPYRRPQDEDGADDDEDERPVDPDELPADDR